MTMVAMMIRAGRDKDRTGTALDEGYIGGAGVSLCG
jgi:hypothetical protein